MRVGRKELSISGRIMGLRKVKRPLEARNEVSRGTQMGRMWPMGRVGWPQCLPPFRSKDPPKASSDTFTVLSM